MTAQQAEVVEEHEKRLKGFRAALEIVESMGDVAVAMTLRRAIHAKEREARAMLQTEPEVALAMRRRRDAEEQRALEQQQEFKEQMQCEKKVKELKREAKECQEKVAKARKLLREAQDLAQTQTALKSFTVEMLGHGRLRGGGAAHRNRRLDVLDRIARHGAEFTPQQRNDWKWFKEAWDDSMSESHNKDWGSTFARIAQHLMERLQGGEVTAASTFMFTETERCLKDIKVLRC